MTTLTVTTLTTLTSDNTDITADEESKKVEDVGGKGDKTDNPVKSSGEGPVKEILVGAYSVVGAIIVVILIVITFCTTTDRSSLHSITSSVQLTNPAGSRGIQF